MWSKQHNGKVSLLWTDLGKSREAILLKRGILMEISHIEGRDFYPKLPKVGKEFLKDRRDSDTV
jgi:hypothetical protein